MNATTLRYGATLLLLVLPTRFAWADSGGTIEGTIDLGKGPFVVYIEKIPGTTPPITPEPVMNQKGNTYLPHVLPIVAGTKVEFRSTDPELHNVYAWSQALKRALFNIAIPPNTPSYHRLFTDPGVVKLTCNVHKEMSAFILVFQNSHFSMVEKGSTHFKLSGVPVGKYDLRVWGEKLDDPVLSRKFPVELAAGQITQISLSP